MLDAASNTEREYREKMGMLENQLQAALDDARKWKNSK
jgi:hypothetical protein